MNDLVQFIPLIFIIFIIYFWYRVFKFIKSKRKAIVKKVSDDIFDDIFGLIKKFAKKILSEPKKVYALALVLIVLFPPMDRVYQGVVQEFMGWNFITGLESRYQINVTYLLIELFLATILFFLFRKNTK